MCVHGRLVPCQRLPTCFPLLSLKPRIAPVFTPLPFCRFANPVKNSAQGILLKRIPHLTNLLTRSTTEIGPKDSSGLGQLFDQSTEPMFWPSLAAHLPLLFLPLQLPR